MLTTVQLFVTCILDSLYPETALATVKVLQEAGVVVEFPPGQTCCGQPAFNAGMRPEARRMAVHTLQAFGETSGPVVLPSGSCAAMVRHSYSELFRGDKQWESAARGLAERTYELTEFLVDVLGNADLGARFPGRLAYHASCHLLRGLGVKRQPQILLNEVKGAEIVPLPESEECCGFGGLFSVEHPEISAVMLTRKIDNILACGAQKIVSCDAGCATHINGGLHRSGLQPRAIHIAEVLAAR
jgi:L-lactate dehydrogenase complex protein LldE